MIIKQVVMKNIMKYAAVLDCIIAFAARVVNHAAKQDLIVGAARLVQHVGKITKNAMNQRNVRIIKPHAMKDQEKNAVVMEHTHANAVKIMTNAASTIKTIGVVRLAQSVEQQKGNVKQQQNAKMKKLYVI